jgi:hypothetical protein
MSAIPRKRAPSAPAASLTRVQLRTCFWGLRRPLGKQSSPSLPFSPTVWADAVTFACAKDRASSFLDGLLRESPTPMLS